MTGRRIYSLRVNALSPLALGNESGIGNFEQSSSFIPGSALRGALAQKTLEACTQPNYLDNHRQCPDRENCPFWEIFGEDDTLVGNAYPGQVEPVYPLPFTARTCKYYPGIATGSEEYILEERHGVFDSLIELFIYELLSDPGFPHRKELLPDLEDKAFTSDPPDVTCPNCHAPLAVAEGYYTPGTPLLPAGDIFVRRQAHVGIDRSRFVAEDSLLFTQEVIDTAGSPISFFGRLVVSEGRANLVEESLSGEHFLGRGRSRGLGQVEVGIQENFPRLTLRERVQMFNQAVSTVLSKWAGFDRKIPSNLPVTLFCLTLQSPAILEKFGRPQLIPTPHEIGLPQAKLLRAWSEPRLISGWDSAAQLPRRTRLAADAGSVYLFYLPTEDLDLTALEEIETEGIGENRTRGFGQVEICSPFHSQNLRPTGGNYG